MKKLVAIISSVLLVGALSMGGYAYYKTPVNFISVDINPSVELGVNAFDKVVSVDAVNADGETILEGQDLKNIKVDEAIVKIIEAADEKDYIADDGTTVVSITAESDDPEKAEELQNIGEEVVNEVTEEKEIPVILYKDCSDLSLRTEAKGLGISPGKFKLMKNVQALDPTITIEQLKDMKVSDIMLKAKELFDKNPELTDEDSEEEVDDTTKQAVEKLKDVAEKAKERKQIAEQRKEIKDNAKAQAKEIKDQAKSNAEQAKKEAKSIKEQAKQQVKELKKQAKELLKNTDGMTEQEKEAAEDAAEQLLDDAENIEKQAEENAKQLEKQAENQKKEAEKQAEQLKKEAEKAAKQQEKTQENDDLDDDDDYDDDDHDNDDDDDDDDDDHDDDTEKDEKNRGRNKIGADISEITFTSGGSEANSWVIRCVAESYHGKPVHIITSEIEHRSVLNACHALEQTDIEVTYLPVNATGVVEVTSIDDAIKPHTKLVSIMLANNEIGTVQPVEEIGRLLKSKGVLFHTDAVQAVGHIPVDVSRLGVDFLTASAHKFNGAKGIGILYKQSGINLSPVVFGGEQERGLRAGTENVAGIVSAGYAIEESISLMADEAKRLRKMVEETVDGIKEKIPSVRVNGDSIFRLPGTVNLGFDGVSGEALMHLLDLKGVCVSTSSACTSGKNEPSHVLLALGLSDQQAKSAIRISYGRYNTVAEVEKVITEVCNAYFKIIGKC